MKRIVVLILSILALACPRKTETPQTNPASLKKTMKVGLLTPGSINDNGWNAIAWEGLQRIRKELGAEISHQETTTPPQMSEGFKSYGAKEYDLAFGHGFEFQGPAKEAAAQYPNTVFITTSGNTLAPNVAPMVFELEQATYLLGVIAARESKTGKAGLVGGINLPSIASTFLAFKAGAQSINPKFEVTDVYTGNFDDPARPSSPRCRSSTPDATSSFTRPTRPDAACSRPARSGRSAASARTRTRTISPPM